MKRHRSFELALAYQPLPGARQFGLLESLRGAIAEGRLVAGTRLPSSRDLAATYGLARATVVAVFEQLASEGYIEARRGAGSFVSQTLPEHYLQRVPPVVAHESGPSAPLRPLSRRVEACLDHPFSLLAGGRPPALAPHIPSLAEFPWAIWQRCSARAHAALGPRARLGGDALGFAPLRQALAAYLGSLRGVVCDPGQILMVSGCQMALDLSTRLLLDAGDAVLVEDPAYPGATAILRAAGLRLVPQPVDDEGLRLSPAVPGFAAAVMACLTPAHQAPTGVALSAARRSAILDWAATRRAWIFEDDYDSEFRYAGQPLPALQGLDRHGCVLHAGSFSKTLFPGLRLGYLVLPASLVDAFGRARALFDRYPSIEMQAALARFIAEGHYASHLRRMRQIYAGRRQALADAVERHASGVLQLGDEAAGLETVAWLPTGADDVAITRRARSAGLGVEAVSPRCLAQTPRAGLLLGFAATPPEAMDAAVEKLLICVMSELRT